MQKRHLFFLLLIPSLVSIGIFLMIVSVLLYNSAPALIQEGVSLYITSYWDPYNNKFGGLFAIYGSILTASIAILISIPLALGLAVFISDIAPKQIKFALINLSDLFSAFPTVLYGFWGLYSLGPFLASTLFKFLNENLGFIPLFSTYTTSGASILLASIVLSLMITPFASSLIREAYAQIPRIIDETVYSLGMGKWELIRIKLSYIKKAFVGAYALAFGRGIGETVAVSLTIGNAINISPSLLSPGYTIPSLIISQFGTAYGLEYHAIFALALFLLVIGILFIVISRLIIR